MCRAGKRLAALVSMGIMDAILDVVNDVQTKKVLNAMTLLVASFPAEYRKQFLRTVRSKSTTHRTACATMFHWLVSS